VRTGRIDDAAEAHRKAYRLIRDKVADLADIGEHIAFCARTGNEHRGLEILQRHLDWLDRAPSPSAAMEFAASGALLLRRLTAVGHGEVLVRRRAFGDRPAAEVPAATLAESLAAQASELAAQFDARNGTSRQGRRIDAILDAEPFGVDVPLSPTARRRSAATPQAPVAAGPAAAPIAPEPTGAPVPPDAEPTTLIQLAEDLERADAVQALVALLDQFDARFADADLPAPVAARRAELRAWQRWLGRDLAASIEASELAGRLYAQAGEPGRASRVSGAAGLARCLAAPLPDGATSDGAVVDGAAAVAADLAYQRGHGDLRDHVGAQSRQAMVCALTGDEEGALAALQELTELLAKAGDARLTARHQLRRGQILARLGRPADAAAAASEARDFYRVHGGPAPFVAACLLHARAVDDPAAQVAAYDEVLAVGADDNEIEVRLGRGRALLQLDQAAAAVDDFVEVVALCTEQGIDDGAAFVRQDLATAYRQCGRPVEAAEVAEEAIGALDGLGHVSAADQVRFLLAGVYQELGEPDAALALYDTLIEREEKAGDQASLGQVLETAGALLFRMDHDAQAAERFAAAADAYRAAEAALDELRALRRQVGALHWADDLPAALEAFRFAVTRHDELAGRLDGQPLAGWERGALDLAVAQVFASRERPAEALPYLSAAAQRFRVIGADDDAERAEQLLAEAQE
ncbi:MAG TPA: tetratricopeptide repeat protein, partial [Actinoplanes sp.]|nr:tetratricopeptide repeat protein [Actinoplanes sp.]